MAVAVGVGALVGVDVAVAVAAGVWVLVGVGVTVVVAVVVAVVVGVAVGASEGIGLGMWVAVGDGVTVAVGVLAAVGAAVGDGRACESAVWASANFGDEVLGAAPDIGSPSDDPGVPHPAMRTTKNTVMITVRDAVSLNLAITLHPTQQPIHPPPSMGIAQSQRRMYAV